MDKVADESRIANRIAEKLLVGEGESINETMRRIDQNGLGIVFIISPEKMLLGTVTDGDIRKALRRGVDVNSAVKDIMNRDPITLPEGFSGQEFREAISKRSFARHYSLKIPVLDAERRVVNLIFYSMGEESYHLLNSAESADSGSENVQSSFRDIKKVLLVGGAGYLGSVLCRKLLQTGFAVRVLDLLLFGEEPLLELLNNPGFELMHGDLRNITTISRALEGVDAVIHLAAIVGDPAGNSQPLHTIETNYLATMTLAQACRYHQINRFIFASTCSVYGTGDYGVEGGALLDESSPLRPVSLYARSKIDSEKGILSLAEGNFAPTIMRMGTLYGLSPRMRFDLVVNTFAMMAATEGKINIFGGEQWRPLLHVEDAAEAYLKCLKAPIDKVKGQVFNVGSEEQNYQISRLGSIVKGTLPETEMIVVPQEKPDLRDYKVSFRKVRETLGFSAARSVEQSVLEISQAIRSGRITDVKDARYYNAV